MTPKEKQILSVIAAVAILAGGYVWAAKYYKTPQPEPQPQNSQIQTEDETADWKTYQNKEYGFEMKYPNSFFYTQKNPKSIVIDGPKDCKKNDSEGYCFEDVIYVDLFKNVNRLNTDDWLTQKNQGFEFLDRKVIAGQDAIVASPVATEGYGRKYIFSNKAGENIFEIIIYSGVNETQREQILSTFKFLK